MRWLFAGTRKFASQVKQSSWLSPDKLFKVKSHRSLDAAASPEERAIIQGNEEADGHAAAGRKAHLAFPEKMADMLRQQTQDVKIVIDLLLALSPVWPDKEGRAERVVADAVSSRLVAGKTKIDPELAHKRRHKDRLLGLKIVGDHQLFCAKIGAEDGKML